METSHSDVPMTSLSTWLDACMAAEPVKCYWQSNALAEKMRWVQTSAGGCACSIWVLTSLVW